MGIENTQFIIQTKDPQIESLSKNNLLRFLFLFLYFFNKWSQASFSSNLI
jgi:hypothetical protein